MSPPLAPLRSRRSFLKLSAVVAAGALAAAAARPLPAAAPSHARLRVQSALPLPNFPYLPFPERLLAAPPGHSEAALVPAYVAAMLIRAGRLQPLNGPAGRPHDPEGRYGVPFAYRVAALRYPGETAAPTTASWADLWAAGGAVWPAFGRVMTGAALLRRGYSPNDTHPGHLAQAAADLARLQPRMAIEPMALFETRPPTLPPLALVLVDPAEIGRANGLRLPAEGTLLVEYDWVITAGPARAAAARQFIDGLRPAAQALRADLPARLIPLMPLPPAALAQHNQIWAMLAAGQPSRAA